VRWVISTVLAGVIFVLPFILLVAIFHYIYTLLNTYLVIPIGQLLVPEGTEDPFQMYGVPALTAIAVLFFLLLMGMLFRTRLRRWVDWGMSRIPGVSTLYSAMQDTAQALVSSPGLRNVDTVVLVPFPQSDVRMAGYLMTRSKQKNGRVLACVYVPLVLFPPSGYTIIVPEDQIVYTDWPTKDVWKLLLSGGLTVPPDIPFDPMEGNISGDETSGQPAADYTGS